MKTTASATQGIARPILGVTLYTAGLKKRTLSYGIDDWFFGQPTFLTHKESSIIDLFMSITVLCDPEMRIFTDKPLSSDHKTISFSFKSIALYQPIQVQRIIWNLGKLKEQNVRDAYTQQVQSTLTRLELSTQSVSHQVDDIKIAQRRIEELNHLIYQIIYDSLDATFGRVTSSYNY